MSRLLTSVGNPKVIKQNKTVMNAIINKLNLYKIFNN
jgi:hypothetical protein